MHRNEVKILDKSKIDSVSTSTGDMALEYLTERETNMFKELFLKNLNSYKEKAADVSDKEWLEQILCAELPEISHEEARLNAEEISNAIQIYDENLKSVNEAAARGISKESWLANKIEEASVGMAVNEYGRTLQAMDDILYQKNMELSKALTVAVDGDIRRINMNPNLDGILAENMIAKTTELSGFVQGKNIRVDVLQSNHANSVDVRAINLDTGKYQNYQLKFGKDAKATIDLIERGNYNNQQIIVPTEQLAEVRAHFKAKGSSKTISDHIDAWGAKGKSFTKEELKELQLAAQEDGLMPSMDYSHYQTKDLALSLGKNVGVIALQTAAITTGLHMASKAFNGERIDSDELIEVAVQTGTDVSIKTITAGTLQIAIRKGIIKFIPQATPAGTIANIACVGIENMKILAKIASGECTTAKGIDQMGRITTSMVGGLYAMGVATAALGITTTGTAVCFAGVAGMIAAIPVVGIPLAIATGFVAGMVAYSGGSKLGESVYNAGKKVAEAAKTVAKSAVRGLKSVGRSFVNAGKKVFNKIFG